ncbi:MAG: hypothetical protein WCL18_10480 [bacterium]
MRSKRGIKFIILVAIFYALLAFNVFHIREKLVPRTTDYLKINIPQSPQDSDQDLESTYLEANTNIQTGHFAANDTTNLENLCNDIAICDKIQFNGDFLDTEKYGYTKIISKIIKFIDDNGSEDKQIQEVINTIEISKENGKRR